MTNQTSNDSGFFEPNQKPSEMVACVKDRLNFMGKSQLNFLEPVAPPSAAFAQHWAERHALTRLTYLTYRVSSSRVYARASGCPKGR